MGAFTRALRALVLLAGFYLIGLVLLALLGLGDWALATSGHHGIGVIRLLILSVVLAVPLVRGLALVRTPPGEGPHGVELTPEAQPRLWELVRALAEEAGTRAPARVLLTADVNAAVSERARLLGLVPGPRALYLGLPLLQGLTEAQLRGVLAHELGHYSHADTRLSGLTSRVREQVGRTVAHLRGESGDGETRKRNVLHRWLAKLYIGYGTLVLRVTLQDARRQEFAADRLAARLAGRTATASALRELPALESSFAYYLDRYALAGTDRGLLPPRGEVFGGYGRLLDARQLELVHLRTELPDEPASPYDSHPPLAARVRRIEELPEDGRTDEGRAAAFGLLDAPERVLAALEDAVLKAPPSGTWARAADWPDLLTRSMDARLGDQDAPLPRALLREKGTAGLPTLLSVIEEGRLWDLARHLPASAEARAAKGRARQAMLRPLLREQLHRMVLADFSVRGRLRWEFSWEGPHAAVLTGDGGAPLVAGPEGREDGGPAVEAAIEAALADRPDTRPLRALCALGDGPQTPKDGLV
ncbi:M48 family metalloprotease [Streptomyces sp. NPDC001255]|uniref:M48 family metalloprotease n=1 Tax=Streptomyces sp. NPDC001255 TaxID=3364550 RepID=UPI00369B0967